MTKKEAIRTAHFVVGTGRCGSTLLSSLLSAHPDILSLSEVFSAIGPENAFMHSTLDGDQLFRVLTEPRREAFELLSAASVPEVGTLPDVHAVAPLSLVALRKLVADPDAILLELDKALSGLPAGPAATLYEYVFDWLCDRFAKKIWVERSGGSLEYVDRIRELWPRAKIVHLYRDGVATALSMAQHPYFRIAVARARLRNPRLEVARALSQDIPLDRFAAYWTGMMLRGLASLEAHGTEHVLTVRYEALVADPRRELTRLAHFIGAEPRPEWLLDCARRVRRPEQSAPSVSELERRALHRLCQPAQRRLKELTS